MQRKTEIPKKPRFRLTIEKAYEVLVDIGADKLPVSIEAIEQRYPNIEIHPYTKHKAQFGIPNELDFDKRNALIDKLNETDPSIWREHLEALVIRARGEKECLIIFDDRVTNRQRRRWSIGHELAHVFCGHLWEFELTSLLRSGLSEDEYGVLETEAHWFVSELFAPSPVLLLLKTRLDSRKINVLCDMSPEASTKKMENIYNCRDFSNHELIGNFSQYIFSRGYLESLYMNTRKRIKPVNFVELYDVCRACSICGAL